MLAGHETTASTMNWLLWELSKDLEYQALCREEIARVRSQVIARGDDDLSITDMENMPYVTAIIKVSGYQRQARFLTRSLTINFQLQETLRYHPIAYHLVKKAGHDDIIPLSTPIRTRSGQLVNEIPVSKGQSVIASVCAYNRQVASWCLLLIFFPANRDVPLPLVFRKSGEKMLTFSILGGTSTVKRKRASLPLAFTVTF